MRYRQRRPLVREGRRRDSSNEKRGDRSERSESTSSKLRRNREDKKGTRRGGRRILRRRVGYRGALPRIPSFLRSTGWRGRRFRRGGRGTEESCPHRWTWQRRSGSFVADLEAPVDLARKCRRRVYSEFAVPRDKTQVTVPRDRAHPG
ncbi:hypothetical protein KM043_008999 [Ampulex compressa]|nr:hypothetical protein KM043_008999 [Ampulex compressa]